MLRKAQRAADAAWAAWMENPNPQTCAASLAAYDNLVRVQSIVWDGTEWSGSPDTQPKGKR